jgi:eukaryotic-like serine/threonine-protein kinase
MAELYLAKDTRTNGMVVLKRILPYLAQEVEFLKMFLDEARIAGQLHHPNIVRLYELGRLDGSTFIAMEWVEGIDLRKVLHKEQERQASIPPGIAAWVIARLCEALQHAHQRAGPDGQPLGIVHRDVSPQNVMVTYRGDVKLVDFGIAKATAWMGRSKPGVIKGKFLYLAPEQLTQDKLDHRADLFALGTLLYEITVGKSPFQRQTTEAVIYSIRREDPEPPAAVLHGYPPKLSRIVMRCLEKDRERRYQSADEVREALDSFIQLEAPTTQDDLRHYLAGLFGDENERTSVYVPPNAQTNAQAARPALMSPEKPSPFADEDRTGPMPGAPLTETPPSVGRRPTREQVLPESSRSKPRDVNVTASLQALESRPSTTLPPLEPSDEPERTKVGRSEGPVAIVEPPPLIARESTRLSEPRQTELNTGHFPAHLEPAAQQPPLADVPSDPLRSTQSPSFSKLLVPPPRLMPLPPVADEVTDPTTANQPAVSRPGAIGEPMMDGVPLGLAVPERTDKVSSPQEVRPRPLRPRRQTAARQKRATFDLQDHISTMANVVDRALAERRTAIIVVVAIAIVVFLAWALWPGSKPSKPKAKTAIEKPVPAAPTTSAE